MSCSIIFKMRKIFYNLLLYWLSRFLDTQCDIYYVYIVAFFLALILIIWYNFPINDERMNYMNFYDDLHTQLMVDEINRQSENDTAIRETRDILQKNAGRF